MDECLTICASGANRGGLCRRETGHGGRCKFDTFADIQRRAEAARKGSGMAILHDGTTYYSGQGRDLAKSLRSGFYSDLEPVRREVDYIRSQYVESPYAEGFGSDVVVADLIVRRIIANREVALAVLGEPITYAMLYHERQMPQCLICSTALDHPDDDREDMRCVEHLAETD